MFSKQTVNDSDINGMKVLLRVDYNVPLAKTGKIISNFRIVQSIPTIRVLRDKGCKIVICAHLGRPKGQVKSQYSLKSVAKELESLLDQKVAFVDDCVGDNVKNATSNMNSGEIVLLENLRFHSGEEGNSEEFAKEIISSTGAEVLVQDAFGVSHRAHASTDAVARLIPAVAGLLLEKEVNTIRLVMENPARPLMAIVGGAKIADKIDIIHAFIDKADMVVIGGAMANTFLKAQGVEVGDSLVDDDELDTAKDIIEKVRQVSSGRSFVFYLPQDGVVTTNVDGKSKTRIVDWDAHVIAEIESYPGKPKPKTMKVAKNEKIVDIGPFSGAFIAGAAQMVKTVIWNGAMGITETEAIHGSIGPFAHGTELVMDALVGKYGNRPFSLLGGGDTVAYVDSHDMRDMFNHVSTGGGASLELMAGHELPAVAVLLDKKG